MLPYQARWVQDAADLKVCEKSRRIGLSWAEAYDDVMHAAAGHGSTTYISYNKDMTSGWIADCADWARRLHGLTLVVDETEELVDEEKIAVYAIRFPSGKQIKALSSAARGLRSRGRPGDRVVIDEAAFVDNIGALIRAAVAILIWGGTIRIISTHHGAENAFAGLVDDIKAARLPYRLHSITFADAGQPNLYGGGPCWIGYDVARRKHLAVHTVFERVGDVLWEREELVMQGTPFRE